MIADITIRGNFKVEMVNSPGEALSFIENEVKHLIVPVRRTIELKELPLGYYYVYEITGIPKE